MLCKELNIKPNIIKLSPKEFTLLIKEKYRPTINSYYLGTYLFLHLSDIADISNQTFLGSDMVPVPISIKKYVLPNNGISFQYGYWENDIVFRYLKKPHIDGLVGLDQILSYNFVAGIEDLDDLAEARARIYGIKSMPKRDFFMQSNWFRGHLAIMQPYETNGKLLLKETANKQFKVTL